MTFITVIDNTVTTLQNDSALTAFCSEKWGKTLTVQKEFRQRTEISLNQCPIIIITRPSVERIWLVGGAKELRHTVALYCGFYQDDRSKTLDESIEYEEKIIDALLADPMRDDNAIDTDPQASVYSEGENNAHFIAIALQIICQVD